MRRVRLYFLDRLHAGLRHAGFRGSFSRGSAASEWFDEHFTYRTKEDCYHIPPAFLVGNCFIVYSSRQTQPNTRAKFTVWRF